MGGGEVKGEKMHKDYASLHLNTKMYTLERFI